MPRPIGQPPRAQFTDTAELKAYEDVVSRATAMGVPNAETYTPYYGQLLHSPLLSAALSSIGKVVRAAGDRGDSYSHADREWVDQVMALELNTEQVQPMHLPDALSAGVRIEAIEALRAGRDHDLTAREQLLTHFIRKTTRGEMDDATWNAVEKDMGPRGVIEFAGFTLYLQLTIRLIQCLNPSQAPTREEIDLMLQEFKSGKRQIPNFRDRIR